MIGRLLFVFLFLNSMLVAQKSTLSGYLTDHKSGETMIGVKIVIPSISAGATTNNYGFYSLSVPSGVYQVEFRSGIYPKEVKEIDLTKDVKLDLELGASFQSLNEVNLKGKKGENVNSTQMGQVELEIETIKTLPAFMGEVDVVKTVQLLPGVGGFKHTPAVRNHELQLFVKAVVSNMNTLIKTLEYCHLD